LEITMTDRKIVQALSPFSTEVNGVPFMVHTGALFQDDDPVVRRNPGAFGDVEVQSSQRPRARLPMSSGSVETASAEPGGRRRLSRKPIDTEVRETEVSTPSEV
jgi:hypothetical protein